MNYKGCTETIRDPMIVVNENKSSFCIVNNENVIVERILVDGCLINSDKERCDWLFVLPSSNRVLYVELKGSDVLKAASQIESTMSATSKKYNAFKKECYIATTRVPKYGSPVQKLKIKFKNDYNAMLQVKNGRVSVDA